MSRLILVVWLALVAGATLWGASVFAGAPGVDRGENMTLIANYAGERDAGGNLKERYRNGTDVAFWGDRAILGNLDQGAVNGEPNGGFRLMDISDPSRPQLISRWKCPGDQSDVSVWEDIVVLSVDKPTHDRCAGAGSWEGVRILSIANPSAPEILTTVATRCGSHTNTMIRDGNRLLVYVLSYPLAGRYNPADKMAPLAAGGPGCNAGDHGVISVVEIPLSNPAGARVVSTPSVRPTIGCHDVTVFEGRDLAAAACLTETQIWDLSEDPTQPEIVAHIPNPPGLNLSHSTTFSNDGRTLVVGDELGGAAASPGCVTDDKRYVSGGLFFFDVKNAAAPQLKGNFKLPQEQASLFCTAHQFNVVPMRADRDVLVSSWYSGATSVIDFTNPADPKQIAYYIPRNPTTPDRQTTEAATWASYWYRGNVYSSNFDEDVNSVSPYSRGLDVFTVDHPAVRGAVDLPRLNPQVQEPLPPQKKPKKPKRAKKRR